jgi:hypothetical protein
MMRAWVPVLGLAACAGDPPLPVITSITASSSAEVDGQTEVYGAWVEFTVSFTAQEPDGYAWILVDGVRSASVYWVNSTPECEDLCPAQVVIGADTSALDEGVHTITAVVADFWEERSSEGTEEFLFRETLYVDTFEVHVDGDNLFGSNIEVEVHLFDADTSDHLACTHEVIAHPTPYTGYRAPLLGVGDLSGWLPPERIGARNLYVVLTEDDDADCPTPPSLETDVPIENEDDLIGPTPPFTTSDLDGGVAFDDLGDVHHVELSFGR